MSIRAQVIFLSCTLLTFSPACLAEDSTTTTPAAPAAPTKEATAKPAKPLPPGIARPAATSPADWGKQEDPDKDSQFHFDGDELSILVKGGDHAHDLSSEISSMTAPRVMQEVKGDFVLEVKVSDVGDTTENAVGTDRTGWNGAGLLLMADEKNYVRLELGGIKRSGQKAVTYINYQLRQNGNLMQWANDEDIPFTARDAAHLRIQRKGNVLAASVSHDGKTYVPFGEQKLPASWSDKITVGVAAGNNTATDFEPTFSGFKLTPGAGNIAPSKP